MTSVGGQETSNGLLRITYPEGLIAKYSSADAVGDGIGTGDGTRTNNIFGRLAVQTEGGCVDAEVAVSRSAQRLEFAPGQGVGKVEDTGDLFHNIGGTGHLHRFVDHRINGMGALCNLAAEVSNLVSPDICDVDSTLYLPAVDEIKSVNSAVSAMVSPASRNSWMVTKGSGVFFQETPRTSGGQVIVGFSLSSMVTYWRNTALLPHSSVMR